MANRRQFIKQVGLGTAGLGLTPLLFACVPPDPIAAPGPSLPRSTPEAQGISSAGIRMFLDEVARSGIEFHSIMLARHGTVVAEGWWTPFAARYRHTLYSLSKSFTSTAVGLAVAAGKLSVEDPVTRFFPDDLPPVVAPNLAAIRVKHLLTMNTGHARDTMGALRASGDNWPKAFLGLAVEFEPGTHFLYNTGASYMLSAIVQKVMGENVHSLLTTRLFDPLGVEGADWEMDPTGVNVGGYGLRVTTEDIAKFGQVYVSRGMWRDQRILPASWVDDATTVQTVSQGGDNDWSQGYGYQFWRCKPAPGFYRGDGAFGQFCIVIPQKDVVIAVTSESADMQRSMTLIWDHLLPAIKTEPAIAEDRTAHRMLTDVLARLSIPTPVGAVSSPRAAQISARTFAVAANPLGVRTVEFATEGDACTFTMDGARGPRSVVCGMGHWVTGDNARLDADDLFPVAGRTNIATTIAAAAAWKTPDTLAMNWQYVENIHHDDITCTFEGDRVTIAFAGSVSTMEKQPDPRPALTGRLA